jgi:hypothetical protein
MAAAANTALRQYGAALGPAVLGVILCQRNLGRRHNRTGSAHSTDPKLRSAPDRLDRLRAHRGARSQTALRGFPGELNARLESLGPTRCSPR